jgi:transcriptional regulator with XRE-family HTH domain
MFPDTLKTLRKRKGLTQGEVSKSIGIARTTYSGYELGTSEPDFNILNKLAEFYDVDPNMLIGKQKENDFSLPEEVILNVIKEAEAEYKVSLRDDPVVESAVRDLIQNLAKMKKSAQKGD